VPYCEKSLAIWVYVAAISFLVGVAMVLCLSGQLLRMAALNFFGIEIEHVDILCLRITIHFFSFLEKIINFFNVVWVLVGTIWIYSINRSNHVCPSALYSFVFYFITSIWCIVLFPTVCVIIVACYQGFSEGIIRARRRSQGNEPIARRSRLVDEQSARYSHPPGDDL